MCINFLNLDESLKIYLPTNVTSDFKEMRLIFGQTFFEVGSIMKTNPQSPSLDNIKYILGTYDKELRPQVAQCQDVHDILQLVSDNCPLDDITLLEFFVKRFNIEEAKALIQKYKEDIKEFKKTKLHECLGEKFSNASPLECEKITIVVEEEVSDLTLKDVKRLSSAVFEKLSPHVKLNVIRKGSFTIICSFSLILSKQLISVARGNIHILRANRVKRLTIGYCTVYEVSIEYTLHKLIYY